MDSFREKDAVHRPDNDHLFFWLMVYIFASTYDK